MKIIAILNIILFLAGAVAFSQNTITGTFPALSNQYVKLVGFEGFSIYTIESIKTDNKGYFKLSYSANDYGMGYLAAEDEKPFIVILAPNEDLTLEGEALALPETVSIKKGKQNLLFEQYASEHPRREQTLSAWEFLAKIYQQDSLFSVHEDPLNAIVQEKQRIREEDRAFLESLDQQLYVSWFLPIRKLVSSVPTIAQYRTEDIPAAIAAFRKMDYKDPRLYKSGLLREAIESHFWLIENSGRPLDSVFIEMNISIDHMIENLSTDEKKLNEITDYLFKLLEQRSLFAASEYLALKVLNDQACTINSDLAFQLESYRAMKIGNIAPNIVFREDLIATSYKTGNSPQKLSDLKNEHVLVVFGASWCPACAEELSQIASLHDKWKLHGMEVVYVSLDDDKQTFKDFARPFPFVSYCDYQMWESPVVKAWHVFATPTMYLLDTNLEILLRPNSVRHIDAWVDWYLVQGIR